MKVSVEITGEARHVSLPESERWIDVHGVCPLCACGRLRVIGDVRRQVVERDTVTAPALALCCGHEVGVLRVVLDTIFGLEEDHAVLQGRPRVY